tara:strand:+ start:6182 stop:6682 length:501 start_codon:yes stop_codon:yes gene_type:complete
MSYHDLTLKDIAQYTDNAISTVGTWKNGRLPGSYSTIEKLATLFKVEPLYLLEGKMSHPLPGGVAAPESPLEAIKELSGQVKASGEAPEGVSFDISTHWQADEDETPPEGRSQQRQYMEVYFKRYLDQVENSPQALAQTWIELQRFFPLRIQETMSLQNMPVGADA